MRGVLVFDEEIQPASHAVELAPGVLVLEERPPLLGADTPGQDQDFLVFDGPPPALVEQTGDLDFILIDPPQHEIWAIVDGPAFMDAMVITSGGPPGPPGPQGEPGPGAFTRWYGEGPPGTIVGSVPGDEYLDTLTGDLYRLQ